MLPICTVATAVKWMFKYGSEFLDEIRILLDNIPFLNDMGVLSFLIQVLAVVVAGKYCGINDSSHVSGEE
jgi:hypothetical protein